MSPPLLQEYPSAGPVDVLFMAGEHSGDAHAALLWNKLRERQPELKAVAVGGPSLSHAGVPLLHDLTASSVVGLIEVMRHYRYFRRLFHEVISWIRHFRPRVVCLVDYPGFNLRLARALREEGLSQPGGGPTRVVQYISPQIWAWKAGRRFRMAEDLNGLAVIFPFEPVCFEDTSLSVDFVGHPFLDPGTPPLAEFDSEGPVLLLPGSRRAAVSRIAPIMLQTCLEWQRLGCERPGLLLYPTEDRRKQLLQAMQKAGVSAEGVRMEPVRSRHRAAAVLTSSGTASLQSALAGLPGALVYRAHPLTYWIGRRLVRVTHLGIASLVLKKTFYPEFLQHQARPNVLAREIMACLDDASRQNRTRKLREELVEALHKPARMDAGEWLLRHWQATDG